MQSYVLAVQLSLNALLTYVVHCEECRFGHHEAILAVVELNNYQEKNIYSIIYKYS